MIDGHIHYAASLGAERLNQIAEEYGFSGIGLQCIPKGEQFPVEEDAFAFKKQAKIPVYIFGGISREVYRNSEQGGQESNLAKALVEEVLRLMDMGCTGVKMLEGKPNVRKENPIPDFDQEVWEPYWALLEREQIPVYMHVNDPEEFWDADKVSAFARKAGWFYDGNYINNEEQYRQVLTVLERHPGLRILFPHFFFLSKQLERLAGILERFPGVYIDVTPGVELYYNLSGQQERAKEFFLKFQDRICFGTDIGARSIIKEAEMPLSIEESRARIALITTFLETKGDYQLSPDGYYIMGIEDKAMHGLGLPEQVLEKVYEKNFRNFISRKV